MKQQILVLTGNREQYLKWLAHQGLTQQEARFVTHRADYESCTEFLYVNPGTFWENPAYGAHLIHHFRRYGRLLTDKAKTAA